MVATSKIYRSHDPAHWRVVQARSVLWVIMWIMLSTAIVPAQNFQNTGTYKGPGLFRVRGAATGLPDTVTGTFEYFGGNQQIGAKNYEQLLLTGTAATKTATMNSNILNSLTVASPVTLTIPSAYVYTLDSLQGKLVENGYVVGRVKKIVDLGKVNADTTFGGIGVTVTWNGVNPGRTTISRTSGTAFSVNGKSSIQRYFDINAATDTLLKANLSITYNPIELQGQNPATLDLWRSPDGGTSWRRQRVSRNGNTLIRSNVPSFGSNGRWTAADDNNLLGPAAYEWEADSLKVFTGNNQIGRARKQLPLAFVARVLDAFEQSVQNQSVRFTIIPPSGSTGSKLTADSATTDSLGRVSTILTFGSAKGQYKVTAVVPGTPSAIDSFFALANSAIAALQLQLAKNTDSVGSVITPIRINAKADDSSLVGQEPIVFKILQAPDTLFKFTKLSDTTNSLGQATTSFLFGKKSGQVLAKAISEDDTTLYLSFILNASPGIATQLGGLPSSVSDTVTKREQFTLNVSDTWGNARRGDTVQFSWSHPAGSTLDSLITKSALVDSLGRAIALVKLGEKVGNYTLTATVSSQPTLQKSVYLKASNDVAAKLIPAVVSFSDTIGTVVPQLQATVNDKYNNSVPKALVSFTLIARPDTTGKVDSAFVHTDSSGKAWTRFTIGNKIGTYVVQAKVNGIDTNFIITAKHGLPQNLLAIGGLGQSKQVLQTLDSLFVVKMIDRAGNPIPKDTVYFTVTDTPATATGHSLSRTVAVTDSQGFASTQFTLGLKVGTYKVRATSSRLNPTEFIAKATAGMAQAVAYNGGDRQRKQILTWLDTAMVVTVHDIGNNPVPGIPVTFTIIDTPRGTWGYALKKDTILTDSLGLAQNWFKFGSKIGAYGIIATSKSTALRDTIHFSATALVGVPKTLAQQSGNAQIGQIGDRLNPFVVQVSDTGGNFVPKVTVNFSIVERPDSDAKFDSLSALAVSTDSSGSALTILTLGNLPGVYKVKAAAIGLKDTTFIAEAILLCGDANHDDYLNIGDLTAIIDHIIGRRILTGYDLFRADMYPPGHPDGKIDIRDAQVCLDSLLYAGWDPTHDWIQTYTSPSTKINTTMVRENKLSTVLTSNSDSSFIQLTHIGSRFTMKNTVPIKGLQAVIYLKQQAILDTVDVVFPRAKMMNVDVKSHGKEVAVVLWNAANIPIDTGSTAIFRLPVQLSANSIDSMSVLMSTDSNVVSLIPWATQDITKLIPRDWMLYQNYPNPFNPSTTIEFDVPEVTGKVPHVAIQIFNILGQKVKTIMQGINDAQRYKVTWDGTNEAGMRVSTGVYFYRLLAGDYASTKKMIMLK